MPCDITNSRARAGPARSAMRCVPPAPGVKPTTASTRPKRADSDAQIMSQPSETSSPAVRQSQCGDGQILQSLYGAKELAEAGDLVRAVAAFQGLDHAVEDIDVRPAGER